MFILDRDKPGFMDYVGQIETKEELSGMVKTKQY